MNTVPQIEPVSSMSRDHKGIIAKLGKGPVILAQRSKPTAVLVSIEEWNRIALQMREYERLKMISSRVRGRVTEDDITFEDFMASLEE